MSWDEDCEIVENECEDFCEDGDSDSPLSCEEECMEDSCGENYDVL